MSKNLQIIITMIPFVSMAVLCFSKKLKDMRFNSLTEFIFIFLVSPLIFAIPPLTLIPISMGKMLHDIGILEVVEGDFLSTATAAVLGSYIFWPAMLVTRIIMGIILLIIMNMLAVTGKVIAKCFDSICYLNKKNN